jgi:hypothetical protein
MRKFLKALGALVIPAISWVVAPIIKAKLDGSQLNGLSGIVRFWKELLSQEIPLWAVLILVVLAASIATLVILSWKTKPTGKTDLRIVVLPTPEPRWGIAAHGNTPTLNLHFLAQLAHRAEGSLQIVKAFLEGTKPAFAFLPIVVAGPYDEPQMIHLGVRPIIAKPGKVLRRRVILVDQFGDKHRTETISFQPIANDVRQFQGGASEIRCHFCGRSVSIEELSESSHVAAHRACIK